MIRNPYAKKRPRPPGWTSSSSSGSSSNVPTLAPAKQQLDPSRSFEVEQSGENPVFGTVFYQKEFFQMLVIHLPLGFASSILFQQHIVLSCLTKEVQSQ